LNPDTRCGRGPLPNGPWCSSRYGESAAPELFRCSAQQPGTLQDQWPGGRGIVAGPDCSGQFGLGCLQPGRVAAAQFHDGLAGDHALTWLGPADDPGGRGRTLSLRWVYTHMIEEYARHNGHADLLRQRIDGATGS
jgi:hypothetical protein